MGRYLTTGFYSWAVVGMLWLICVFNYADRQAIFSVFELLKSEMDLSDVQLGIVGGSFMWVYAFALPFAGVIADLANRKALILGGLLFWSAVTLATGWATAYWHLVLLRALEGLGEAFYFPASMSLLSDYHGRKTRSLAMGLHQSSVYVGTVLGGSVAGYCADYFGWRLGFYLFGSLGLGVAAVLVFFLREPPRGAADRRARQQRGDVAESIVEVTHIPMAVVLTLVFIGANFVALIFLTWMPTYLKRQFGMSLTLSGFTATVWLQAASVIGVLVGGLLADLWAPRRRGGRALVQVLGLLAGTPLVFLTGWARDVDVLVLAMAGFGFCKGLYDANIWASLYDVVPLRYRGTAQGLMNFVGWLGASPAPVAVAWAAARYGMGACLSATSVVYLLCGGLLLAGVIIFFPRPTTSDTPPLAGQGSPLDE
jgi:MFS family permease